MVNYGEISDFEINKRVALALGLKIKFISLDSDDKEVGIIVGKKYTPEKRVFDPCNNPADAWPIIVGNKINLYFSNNDQLAQFYQHGQESVEAYHHNALRAAMIVFLMMQDEKNG